MSQPLNFGARLFRREGSLDDRTIYWRYQQTEVDRRDQKTIDLLFNIFMHSIP